MAPLIDPEAHFPRLDREKGGGEGGEAEEEYAVYITAFVTLECTCNFL